MIVAKTDLDLNNQYGWTLGAEPMIVPAQQPYTAPILEPGFSAYAELHPTHPTSVYAAPALIPTAAVGANPWDHVFGPINTGQAANVTALPLPAQVSSVSMG